MRSIGVPLLVLLAALPAMAEEGVERGRWMATQLCSSCHTIAAQGPAGRNPASPPFPAIAARANITADRIAAYVRQPHANMPDHGLTARQAQDLAAFILMQRPR
jgi:mono/diheme cytochrome c family protein